MKIYKLFTAVLSGMFLYSCTEPLNNPLEDVNISVQTGDGVTVENNVITVTRNTPVKFNIMGEPDNITFYSGESGHNYDFRTRTFIDPGQIISSELSFDIEHQYKNPEFHENLYSIYISETFPGLFKNDFPADCKLLSEFSDWKELVAQENLPKQKDDKKTYSIPFYEYLGKNITLAVDYHPEKPDQPKVNFTNFKIENKLRDGTMITIMPSNMGFTPVNIWSADLTGITIKEDDLKKNTGYYDGEEKLIESALWYGSVTNNISGMWNLKNVNLGNFSVHSTNAGDGLRPTWLVSDYLIINGCEPDKGTALKNIANRFESYEYTYGTPGTYKAVFVLSNANYKEENNRIITMIINVK